MAAKNENPSLDISKLLIELRNAFLAELPARLETIESLILELNKTPDFSENYKSLFRHVHSLKGSAGTHGLHIVTTVCHALEDEIVTVEGNQAIVSGDLVTAWLGYIDLLRSTMEDFHAGREDFSAVEVTLAEMRDRGKDRQHNGLLVIGAGVHRQMCQLAFNDWPVNLALCENGYHALGRLLHEPFDFLVTNMELPLLNGKALICALRMSNGRNRHIPSVLLTSRTTVRSDRVTDPDYVVLKDATMVRNLGQTTQKIIKTLTRQAAPATPTVSVSGAPRQ